MRAEVTGSLAFISALMSCQCLTSPLLFLTQISKKQVVLVLSSTLLELEHLKHVLLFVIRSTHTYPSIIVDYAVLLQRTQNAQSGFVQSSLPPALYFHCFVSSSILL